jgi:hypothetical protein
MILQPKRSSRGLGPATLRGIIPAQLGRSSFFLVIVGAASVAGVPTVSVEGALETVEPEKPQSSDRGNSSDKRQRQPMRPEKALTQTEKSAAALSCSVPSGWIVVSAEEAKRLREHVTHPTQPRFEAPLTAFGGRRAFKMLFGDTVESFDVSLEAKAAE